MGTVIEHRAADSYDCVLFRANDDVVRCPEPNQPRVVPPLYDANGLGVTALKNPPLNPLTGAFELRIADGRDNPTVGALQESGRIYSCDEFPPATWIEGGVGTPGQNNPEGDGQ